MGYSHAVEFMKEMGFVTATDEPQREKLRHHILRCLAALLELPPCSQNLAGIATAKLFCAALGRTVCLMQREVGDFAGRFAEEDKENQRGSISRSAKSANAEDDSDDEDSFDKEEDEDEDDGGMESAAVSLFLSTNLLPSLRRKNVVADATANVWFPLQWMMLLSSSEGSMGACEKNQCLTMSDVRVLVREFGVQSLVQDGIAGEFSPMHVLMTLKSPSVRMLRFLSEVLPRWGNADMRGFGDEARVYPLHIAVQFLTNASALPVILQANPSATKHRRFSVLHELLRRPRFREQCSMVKVLLEADADLVCVRDKDGWLPLHRACVSVAYADVVDVLLEACPAQLKKRFVNDYGGWLPLHYVCRWETGRSVERVETQLRVVKRMVEMYPEGVRCKGEHDGLCPAHVAASSASTTSVMKVLVDAYPEVLMEYAFGTPFQIACMYSNVPMVRYLHSCDPVGSVRVHPTAGTKNVAMNVACMYGSAAVIREVYSMCPAALENVGEGGNTPLHNFVGCRKWSSFRNPVGDMAEVLRFLISRGGDAACMRSASGMTPYTMSRMMCHPEYVQRLLLEAKWAGLCGEVDDATRLELFRLRYRARRGALYMAFVGTTADLSPTIWRRLANHKSDELLRAVVSFL